jgi:hypothetical protein
MVRRCPFENAHKIIDCEARGEVLHVQFNEGESLYVWSPLQAELNRTMFKIQNAARVRFEWFYYGRPKTDQNRYFMDFTRTDHRIDAQNNVDWCTLTLRPMHQGSAVEFVAGMINGLWDGHWGRHRTRNAQRLDNVLSSRAPRDMMHSPGKDHHHAGVHRLQN